MRRRLRRCTRGASTLSGRCREFRHKPAGRSVDKETGEEENAQYRIDPGSKAPSAELHSPPPARCVRNRGNVDACGRPIPGAGHRRRPSRPPSACRRSTSSCARSPLRNRSSGLDSFAFPLTALRMIYDTGASGVILFEGPAQALGRSGGAVSRQRRRLHGCRGRREYDVQRLRPDPHEPGKLHAGSAQSLYDGRRLSAADSGSAAAARSARLRRALHRRLHAAGHRRNARHGRQGVGDQSQAGRSVDSSS